MKQHRKKYTYNPNNPYKAIGSGPRKKPRRQSLRDLALRTIVVVVLMGGLVYGASRMFMGDPETVEDIASSSLQPTLVEVDTGEISEENGPSTNESLPKAPAPDPIEEVKEQLTENRDAPNDTVVEEVLSPQDEKDVAVAAMIEDENQEEATIGGDE